MTNQEAYVLGFAKTAEAYGVDPVELYKFSEAKKAAGHYVMLKQAGKFGPLARLVTKLSPKVDPKKLNWFTRLFTNSHTALAKSNPVPKGRRVRLNWDPESASSSFSRLGFDKNLPPVLRDVTRISPLKILAGGSAAGGGVAITANALRNKKDNSVDNNPVDDSTKDSLVDVIKNMDPTLKKKILIGLGVGATGLASIGLTRAALSNRPR